MTSSVYRPLSSCRSVPSRAMTVAHPGNVSLEFDCLPLPMRSKRGCESALYTFKKRGSSEVESTYRRRPYFALSKTR